MAGRFAISSARQRASRALRTYDQRVVHGLPGRSSFEGGTAHLRAERYGARGFLLSIGWR